MSNSNTEQAEAEFQQWLQRMPEIKLDEYVTVTLPLTLQMHDWADAIQGALRNGWTVAEALQHVLSEYSHGALLNWANEDFISEDERDAKETERWRKQKEAAAAEQEKDDDDNEGEEWKKESA